MTRCRLCQAEGVKQVLDAGLHPVSNRFLADPAEEECLFSLSLGQCTACGLVQLQDLVPASELVSPYDWITYNEAEGHLDRLVEVIAGLPGISRESAVCGVSYKEDSTLARLNRLGFRNTWRVTSEELDISDPCQGLETIQRRLEPQRAQRLRDGHGPADIVIARHILEHAHDILRFLSALQTLARPDGYVIVEVPDCTSCLELQDYTTLWEEHVLYFTPDTLHRCLNTGGFDVERLEVYPYPYENSLVAIARPSAVAASAGQAGEWELSRVARFGAGLHQRRGRYQQALSNYRKDGGTIALFGAGHLACMFIDLMDLKSAIDFVVDDHPRKRGLYMPGSRLPIVGSDVLLTEDVRLCLLSLSPESEERVVQKWETFQERGGRFASIFPSSKRALRL